MAFDTTDVLLSILKIVIILSVWLTVAPIMLWVERRGSALTTRRHAAVDAERQAHQRIAEQRGAHVPERQHALDEAALLRVEKVGVVAEDAAHDALPAGAVEEGGLGAGHDEGVPRGIGAGVVG